MSGRGPFASSGPWPVALVVLAVVLVAFAAFPGPWLIR